MYNQKQFIVYFVFNIVFALSIREEWMNSIREARRISWRNQNLSEHKMRKALQDMYIERLRLENEKDAESVLVHELKDMKVSLEKEKEVCPLGCLFFVHADDI